jgi:uncharacterized integral membrane protein
VFGSHPGGLIIEKQASKDFLFSEYEYVSHHMEVIHETRDRFFQNFMTIAVALFGFLGFLLKDKESTSGLSPLPPHLKLFLVLALIMLMAFGVGTLFLISANWIARDYYRQRRRQLRQMLIRNLPPEELRRRLDEYAAFSRDKAQWRLRFTSVYFIYNTAIAIANSTAIVFVFHATVSELSLPLAIFAAAFLILLHHLLALAYIAAYQNQRYSDG